MAVVEPVATEEAIRPALMVTVEVEMAEGVQAASLTPRSSVPNHIQELRSHIHRLQRQYLGGSRNLRYRRSPDKHQRLDCIDSSNPGSHLISQERVLGLPLAQH